jgi:MOSC domain-containing protein YiiM
VREVGLLAAADGFELSASAEPTVSIAEFLRAHLSKGRDAGAIRRALAAPGLSDGWRARFEKALASG